MANVIKVAIYPDGNEFITKFNFVRSDCEVYLLNVVGDRKGPYGRNLIVEQNGVRFALPKLRGLATITKNGLYAIQVNGIKSKSNGRYKMVDIQVQAITKEQFCKMAELIPQPNMLEGVGYSFKTISSESSPAKPATKPAKPATKNSEYFDMKSLISFFKQYKISVRYYSEDHFCLIDGSRFRISETKNGFKIADAEAILKRCQARREKA